MMTSCAMACAPISLRSTEVLAVMSMDIGPLRCSGTETAMSTWGVDARTGGGRALVVGPFGGATFRGAERATGGRAVEEEACCDAGRALEVIAFGCAR